MKKLEFEYFGKKMNLILFPSYYMDNGNLAVSLKESGAKEDEMFGILTCNLGEQVGKNMAFINVNAYGDHIIDWLVKNNLGEPTGRKENSGFCVYPEFLFDETILKEYKTKDYDEYLDWHQQMGDTKALLMPECTHCCNIYPIIVAKDAAKKYEEYLSEGKYLIQDIFPEMDASTRAVLARGHICGSCFKKMFG